jgi:hypothetical protein
MKKLIIAVDGNNFRLTSDRYEKGTPTHEIKNAYDIGLSTGQGIYSNVGWTYVATMPGTYNIAVVQADEAVQLPDGWVGRPFMRLIHTNSLKAVGTRIDAGNQIYSSGTAGTGAPHIHIEFTKTFNGTVGAGQDAQGRSLPVDGFTEVNIEDFMYINGATTLGETFGHNIRQIDNDNVENNTPAPQPTGQLYVNLQPEAGLVTVYKDCDKASGRLSREVGKLNPAQFGGLTYTALEINDAGTGHRNVVIDTSAFGGVWVQMDYDYRDLLPTQSYPLVK